MGSEMEDMIVVRTLAFIAFTVVLVSLGYAPWTRDVLGDVRVPAWCYTQGPQQLVESWPAEPHGTELLCINWLLHWNTP